MARAGVDQGKSINQVVAQLGEFAGSLSLKQKAILAAGAVLVAATLFVFVRLIGKPEMKTLFTGMKPEEAQALSAKLAAKNIPYEISPDGSIRVPAEQVDAARLEAVSDGMPRSGRMGFEIFDKPNWGGSDFSEKVNYQRALEGELERTIQTLSEVESARVHLVMPGDSIFVDDQREAKAAVTVKLRGGRYSGETSRAIARLVASSVERLRPENVTVVDADTNAPLDAGLGSNGARGSDIEQQLAEKLIRTLEPVVGPERARASVRVEYDLTSSEEEQETYDPNTAVALSMQKNEERSGSPISSGVPGTASNLPNSQAKTTAVVQANDGSTYSRSENGTYAVNKLVRHTVLPAGRVKRIAAALVIDDATEVKTTNGRKSDARRKRTPEELKQIEELAKAAIGIDATRGDVLSVQNLSFQQGSGDTPVPPSFAEKTRTLVGDYASLIRYGAIALLFLVIYGLLLRPVKKQALAAFRQIGHGRAVIAGKLPGNAGSAIGGTIEIDAEDLSLNSANPEAKRAAALKRQLLDKVKAEPVAASRLVQSWIRQGGTE
jgi:flagellar M-ring protein FliF